MLSIEPIYLLVENDNGYTLTETEGEMYFCNARCLCIWAVQLATRPNLTDDRKLPGVQLTQATGEQRTFADVGGISKMVRGERTHSGVTVTSCKPT